MTLAEMLYQMIDPSIRASYERLLHRLRVWFNRWLQSLRNPIPTYTQSLLRL